MLRWALAFAAAAYAAHLAVVHATPIDRSLPLLAVAVTVVAAVSYPSIMLAVPLLLAAEIAIADETARLLAFGAILGTSFAIAIADRRPSRRFDDSATGRLARPTARPILTTVAAIVILRWIPLESVLAGRELFLLAVAVLIVVVLGRTPFSATVAIVTVLVTPAVPLRTLALPIIVLVVAVLARFLGMPSVALVWPSAMVAGFVLLFFAWSGVVARGFPYFLHRAEPHRPAQVVARAVAAGSGVTLDVPEGTAALVVSGANIAGLPRGAPLAQVDPGGIIVRVGDAADWGYMRREHYYGSRNALPANPAGTVRGYGYEAWVDGAGRVPLPRGARAIRVTADSALPAGAALQIERFELRP